MGAKHTGRFGKRIGCTGWVKITVLVVPKGGIVMFRINQRMPFSDLGWTDELLVKAHIPRL